jgi:hypothetical protein
VEFFFIGQAVEETPYVLPTACLSHAEVEVERVGLKGHGEYKGLLRARDPVRVLAKNLFGRLTILEHLRDLSGIKGLSLFMPPYQLLVVVPKGLLMPDFIQCEPFKGSSDVTIR